METDVRQSALREKEDLQKPRIRGEPLWEHGGWAGVGGGDL